MLQKKYWSLRIRKSSKALLLLATFYSLSTIYYLLFPKVTKAVCPVCTVAVGAGLGLSRYLGIDDAVSSIWIGGLILSSSFWLTDWLKKKYPKLLHLRGEIGSHLGYYVTASMYLLVIIPLLLSGVIGHPANTIMGIDKIVWGTVVGSLVFLFAMWADKKVRNIKGKQLFSYQKVILPVSSLAITSLLIYFYGGYLY